MMGKHEKLLPPTLQHVCDVLPERDRTTYCRAEPFQRNIEIFSLYLKSWLSPVRCNHNALTKDSLSFYILISALIKYKLIRLTDPHH